MASLRPQKDALYAQKVIQGSKSDTRDLVAGTDQNGVSPDDRVTDAFTAKDDFLTNLASLIFVCLRLP